jgi:hypothetical protein
MRIGGLFPDGTQRDTNQSQDCRKKLSVVSHDLRHYPLVVHMLNAKKCDKSHTLAFSNCTCGLSYIMFEPVSLFLVGVAEQLYYVFH